MAIITTTPDLLSKVLVSNMRNIIRDSLSKELKRVFNEELEKLIEEKVTEVISQVQEVYDIPSGKQEIKINVKVINE